MRIGKYTLANSDKLERAINGTILDQGRMTGGVGADADESEIIAEYDRLGGLILKDDKYKVKTGSFYDFKTKKAIAKPKPVLLFTVNGEVVEVDADEPLPLEIRASEAAHDKKKAKAKAVADKKTTAKQKNAAARKAKAAKDEDTEDESEDSDVDEDSDEDEEGTELA